MSSWQKYKKKKQGKSNTISSNNSEMSSWEKYKQEKKSTTTNNSKLPTAKTTNKGNGISNILGNLGYGLSNGLISLQQQFNRVTKKGINDRLNIGNKINSKLNLPTSQDMLKNMLGENSDKPITNIGEKLEKQKQTNTENIQRNIDNSNNIVTKKLAEVAPSIGQMLPGMLPGIGSTYFAGSASGNYYDEAKQRGMSEKEAEKYSAIMGLAEGGAEALGGKITKSIGKNLIKGNAKQALKMFGLDILENFAEEAIMEPLSEATATVAAGKDKADWNNIGKRMLQSGFDGAIVATIMGGASAGIGSSVNIVNKIAKGEKVTSAEINTAKNDMQNKMTDADVQEKIKEAETIINNINNQTNQPTQQNTQDIVENNQETLYNNNERESGIYEQYKGNINERRNGIHEEQKNIQNRQYNWTEYNDWEQSIKPITANNLTDSEKKSIKKAKIEHNKDVILYDENNNNTTYSGGASKDVIGKITISKQKAEIFGLDKMISHETIESDIIHNEKANDILSPVINLIKEDNKFDLQKDKFWEGQETNIPSDDLIAKDILCDRFSEIINGEELDYENVLDNATNSTIDMALNNYYQQIYGKELEQSSSFIMPTPEKTMQDVGAPINKKTLNPTEISNLTTNDADTTPNLSPRNYERGNKESSFLSNITTDAGFLNEDLRHEMAKEDNIRYYKGITNQETLEKAYNSLNKDGKNATLNWFNKESKNVTAEDVAKGWILLKQYQDAGDYQSAVEVAKKMREMGTSAGQATQAYNILSRLTPEGMFYYAQSELTEAYNQMVKGKSKEWIDKNASKFDLTAEETQIIMDTMQDVSTMEDGYDKKVKIAEIQKLISDKIPPTAGQSIKAWMRISMLFNTKTQVRNILGNAVILPVNMTSDFISSNIDKAISKKTGVRTTGNTNLKSYGKGFKKGLYESYNDFRKGINTRNIEGNRFEVSEGKSFKDSGIGKALNRVDNILSFALDGGDRGFYEATFTNSINNQLILNNTTEVTAEMIEIATNEALQRTWQDNNEYTKAVLQIRKILNKFGTKSYGLGDVLIPFAKTPANLTKAIVDYSPVGLVKAITLDARTFKNSLENGQYTPQMQHKLVQNIGKGMAGSFLYVLGYALAKAGIASGEADDDKDVKNFMKNSLGISSYSIKIGNKTFTYDWAQPVATPLAIMTNYVKYSKDNPDANIIEKAIKSLNIGTEQLLQQSFMDSLNTVLNGSGTTLENLTQAVLELPARAIPTFSKQVADMVDGTQRTSFEYDKPLKSAINSITAKVPFASKTLPISRDTLGNEIKKYGGDNNIFNVMFNPANVNKGELTKAGEEIYRLYQEIGETSVFPITAPYYINSKGEKITMTAEERSNYQKVTGEYTEKAINELLSNSAYKKLTDEKKAELIKEIISDSNAKAKYDILKIETDDAKKKRELIEKAGTKSYYDYKFKTKDLEKEIEKVEVLANANYSNKIKETIYESTIGKDDSLYGIMKESNIDSTEYLKYKSQKFESNKKDDGTTTGKTISGSKKNKVYEYVNNMDITYNQKLLLLGTQYSLTSAEKTKLAHYINDMNISKKRKMEIYDKISGFTVYKDGRIKW